MFSHEARVAELHEGRSDLMARVQDVLRNLVVPCEENPLPVSELEIDEFQFHYTANERPHIQNDTITISHKLANDHSIKLSISHALAQVHFPNPIRRVLTILSELPALGDAGIAAESLRFFTARDCCAKLPHTVLYFERGSDHFYVPEFPEFNVVCGSIQKRIYHHCLIASNVNDIDHQVVTSMSPPSRFGVETMFGLHAATIDE
jgi:hypothetical protein